MTKFSDLGLTEALLKAVKAEGYDTATPIQAQAIPHLLQGRDVLGLAQTGTGKTAAFALPILQRLMENRRPPRPGTARALILTPTRELALQIGTCFAAYGRYQSLRHAVIFGGVGQQSQIDALQSGLDILVATPGRLLDLMQQGHARLDGIEIFVLDEADRMLDMGFIRDIRKIIPKLPKVRQTLLFSATMPEAITELATGLLTDYARVEVTPPATTVERIEQRVLFVAQSDKGRLLVDLLQDQAMDRSIVFTRTKHGANRVVERLQKAGINSYAIHGNKSQSARQNALEAFRSGKVKTLIATDIAARGIDIDGITHVINFDLPNEPESYVHRIGRTARAGRDGVALSFCAAEEVAFLRDIEKTIRRTVTVETAHAYHSTAIASQSAQGQASVSKSAPNQSKGPRSRRRRRSGQGKAA